MTFQTALLEDNSFIIDLIIGWFLQNSKADYCQVCLHNRKCELCSNDIKQDSEQKKQCIDGIYGYFKSGAWQDKVTAQVKKLKLIKKFLGISQAELAEILGVSAATIYTWERGLIFPNKKYLARISDFCLKYDDKADEYQRVSEELNPFGYKVQRVRVRLGLTQADFAERLGLYPNAVYRWENGKTAPTKQSREIFDKFCKENGIEDDVEEMVALRDYLNSGQFNEKVKRVRTELNLTQTELAKELGVGVSTISRWEKGSEAPPKRNAEKFLKFCRSKNLL